MSGRRFTIAWSRPTGQVDGDGMHVGLVSTAVVEIGADGRHRAIEGPKTGTIRTATPLQARCTAVPAS